MAGMGGGALGRWLVVGHGSVGSALVRRLRENGQDADIFDPLPRVSIEHGRLLDSLAPPLQPYDVVVSCVPPIAALDVAASIAPAVRPTTILLDWNTLVPGAKRDVAARTVASVVDVALLGTLDEAERRPSLAISGDAASAIAGALVSLGFHVDVVGDEPGDAARLKVARSLYMKTLEALVVEFESAIATLPGRDVVRASIEGDLGETYAAFARLLLRTDQLHARRRHRELEAAVEVYREERRQLPLAESAIGVLAAAAQAWDQPDAPPVGSDHDTLVSFLGRTLDAQH